MITRVKGTQDFLDLTLFNFIIASAKKHLTTYTYTEIATPILEPIDLFKRSLGVYTDVVTKEMFVIDNKGKEPEYCLRPEMTASTVRAFLENGIQTTPWHVFSYGPLFRYERPQKGRYRQFHQINIESIGVPGIMYDVQLIALLDDLFGRVFNLSSYALHINFLGTPEDRAAHKDAFKAFLEKHIAQLCPTCVVRKDTNTMRVLDCKNESCQLLYRTAPMITDFLSDASQHEWQTLQKNLSLLGVSYTHKPTLVRGLDYYNKTVFEFLSDNLGAQNAFCGGGRYDHLVEQLGGKKDQPSLGAAIGIERLLLLLEPLRDSLPIAHAPALHVIMPFAEEYQPLALLLAQQLRMHKLCTEVQLDGGSVKRMMRHAHKAGATYVLLLGEDEHKAQTVTVKDMRTGYAEVVAQVDLVAYLTKK